MANLMFAIEFRRYHICKYGYCNVGTIIANLDDGQYGRKSMASRCRISTSLNKLFDRHKFVWAIGTHDWTVVGCFAWLSYNRHFIALCK